jgi:hypothetical protein
MAHSARRPTTVPDSKPAKKAAPNPFDPATALHAMLPGLAWTQAVLDQTGRSQAALAADALRQINAPMLDALARHRELATALTTTADQMAAMAKNLQLLAKQHTELADRMQAALDPYLKYVDWLGKLGKGEDPR